ncbi:hypothetical protein LHJ74_10945 [Streptomyces sp. N2-109]|uniref:LPS export ABC transporter periplasmic protein LptC n=1 Tax=Streptomyces gossypii TaxID=2883101 RepID=A0ABT2JRA4_9ACTN|nr:hypothetical protein [Streptomyces gossypii]MCT2590421.1 hypothetical protein [Streptomyces gossypii]
MAGSDKPPEGPFEEPPGGDDEYRSLVFDESFVEAARLQEFSAQERLADEQHAAVRSRPGGIAGRVMGRGPGLGKSRQGIVLVLLITLAFGTAIYMGIHNPYQDPGATPAQPMRVTTQPLVPQDAVPGGKPADLFEHSPAARFRAGAKGVPLPDAHRTDHFSENQILAALTSAKEYVVASSLDPAVLTGGAVSSVRVLLDTGQLEQFDRSVESPGNEARRASTGWMVRFDPSQVALAGRDVRVDGDMAVEETAPDVLEVTADHVFVYAVRPAQSGDDGGEETKAARNADGASLFTVRREVRFHFDRSDLRDQQLSVQQVSMRAGPMACSADPSEALRPMTAGERAEKGGPAGTDPYVRDRSSGSMCGVLADSAQPQSADPAR